MQRIEGNAAESGTTVLMTWRQWPAGTTLDPVTQSREATVTTTDPDTQEQVVTQVQPTHSSARVGAFLHFPEVKGNSEVRQFNEIEAGDCIVDFPPEAAIPTPGLLVDNLEFVFLDEQGNYVDLKADGRPQKWVTKPVSETLTRCLGAIVQGRRLWRPVLLRRAT